MMRY